MHVSRTGPCRLGLLACGAGGTCIEAVAAEVTVVDAAGRSVRIGDASRILSIGGDVTEIVLTRSAPAPASSPSTRPASSRPRR